MGGQAPPDAGIRARSGRPAGGRRSRGCPDAGHAGRRLSASSVRRADVRPIAHADVRCPRVRCPRDRCVKCPVWASRRPLSGVGVRCPVSSGRPVIWASGVRYPGVPASAVSEPGELVKRADAASSHTARTARVGVVAPHGIHDRLVVCPSRSLTLEAGAGRAGPTEASAWPWSSGGPRPAAGLDRLADQEEPVAQGPLVGREPGTRRGSPTCGMAGRRSSGT